MSSKYPSQYDMFQMKRNAQFEGDPNGDYVMAEDINELQDAISSIEKALGTNPQGNKLSVGDRITLLEGSSVLRVPPFLLYLGNPALINGAASIEEAVSHYLKYDHIVFGNNADEDGDTDHTNTQEIINAIKTSRDVKIYGYIDCGMTTSGFDIAEIQNKIQAWKDMDVTGIYCGNFDFDKEVSRERQNLILDSIHQYDLIAIVNGNDPVQVLSNSYDEAMNPGQLLPNIKEGDIYHYDNFVINTLSQTIYESFAITLAKLNQLYEFRQSLGINILATPTISSNIDTETANMYFEYAHNIALLGSVDMFHPVVENYGEVVNLNKTYNTTAVVGDWYVTVPSIKSVGSEYVRETAFGSIYINPTNHTARYEGLYIPYEILRINLNSIEGNLLKDGSVSDSKIESYNGQRLIGAINSDLSSDTINITKIANLQYTDISGDVPVNRLTANVITAINASIGSAKIDQAFIGNLNASKITAGTINADLIKGSVVQALNLYTETMTAESATINNAAIGKLSADKITASVVEAINLYAESMTADSAALNTAVIKSLTADKITAGDIKAERLQSEVIKAINTYTDSLVADKAVIKAAAISALTATHIQAAVINAINTTTDTAKINNAKISELTADHIKASVFEAIEANVHNAKIDQANIGDLSASKITAGDIDADRIKAAVVDAIQLYADELGTQAKPIPNAVIKNLDADQITTGDLSAELLKANIIEAMTLYVEELGTAAQPIPNAVIKDLSADQITSGSIKTELMQTNIVSAMNAYIDAMDVNSAKIKSAGIGVLSVDHMQAAVLSAINASVEMIDGKFANINKAKIGQLDADNLEADSITSEKIVAGAVTSDKIEAKAIKADKLDVGAVTADALSAKAVTAEKIDVGAVNATHIATDSIESNHIKAGQVTADELAANSVTADKIEAKAIKTDKLDVGAVIADTIATDAITSDKIMADAVNATKIVADAIESKHLSTGSVTADALYAGSVTADAIAAEAVTAQKIKAGAIEAGHLSVGSVEANAIKAGSISSDKIVTEGLDAQVIKTGFLSANRIQVDSLTGDKIKANQITSNHIVTAGLDASIIKAGFINGDRIQARSLSANVLEAYSITSTELASGSVTADNLAAGSVTTESLRSGIITAEHISTVGLDAQSITVYDSKTGQTLVGGGYLRVDGLDVGVIQSDNLVANGLFLTSSSSYGFKHDNPLGEAVLGSKSTTPGGHQVWKIDLTTGSAIAKIDIPGKKPVDIAINTTDSKYAYITVQGDDTVVQLDLMSDTLSRTPEGDIVKLQAGKGPGRIKFTGDMLMDMKHLFVLNTDPTDINVPDSLIVIDSPPTSFNGGLYNHHFIPLGNTPYDYVLAPNMYTYVTNSSSGDISVIDMTDHNSTEWHVKYSIPIGAMGTDNYHGGLPAQFGLNEVVGGDAAGQYSASMGASSMESMHHHGGYGTTDGTMRTYTPHGIAASSDPNILFVADYANGELLVIDINGKAPYSKMTGSRSGGNLGEVTPGSGNYNSAPPGMGDSTDRVPYWIDPNTPLSAPTDTDPATAPPSDGGGMPGHTMSIESTEEPVFSIAMTGHDMGSDIGVSDTPPNREDLMPVSGGGPTTKWVWYRIPIGDSPDMVELVNGNIVVTLEGSGQIAVISEQTILDQLNSDRGYYSDFDEFEDLAPLPMFTFDYYTLGSKPQRMDVKGNCIFITLAGQNQVVKFNADTRVIEQRYNVGANPKGLEVTADGAYMYVVNHGGTGELSFVYPQGNYIGDPYLGLEGGVEYQGAEYWTPSRTSWIYDSNGDIRSASTVEFRINEPFLNEGGYLKLTAYGKDYQMAQVEQDLFNVTNYSNGNNIANVIGGRLKANATNETFYPVEQWLQSPVPTNFKIVTLDGQGHPVYVDADPATYTVYYEPDSRIVFQKDIVPVDHWVIADYTYRDNKYFKPHNGSVLLAIENSSSPKFDLTFEIDEFVPKFVSIDNQQTESFVPIEDGINEEYEGIEYSTMTNRAVGGVVTSSVAPVTGALTSITDGKEPADTNEEQGHTMMQMDIGEPVFEIMHSMGEEVQFPSGLQNVTVDLGKAYMIGHVVIMHSFHKKRKYHNTKTQVSEDGETWTTIFDSAVSGEYNEYFEDATTGYRMYGNHIEFNARPVRYVRDYANGYTEYDVNWENPVEHTENYWTEIKAYGDWEVEYDYVWPDSSLEAGEQIATNGKCFVSTDIPKAYVAVNTPIEYTTWWYMTYIIGPEFGELDVEMPTMMGGSHSLFQDAPYINKVAHRHIMSYPPSNNIKEDPSMGIKAGMHRAVLRQKSGRVTFDRVRFEDFQRYSTNTASVTPDKSASFTRHKIVTKKAQWYVGQGNQSTYGAYDTPRLNPDSGERDYSVPLKYRFRIKAELNVPDGNTIEERGVAYATSAIFESGQLSTHWRRSEASDSIPGIRLEAWDGNQPHKTGIQHFHLANGSVRGTKIMPMSIMDYHVNPYARIKEAKLQLNYPTHRHGRLVPITGGMPGMMMFVSNKDIIDSIEGWGTNGTANTIARADHLHDDRYVLKGANGSVTGLDVQGSITITGTVDGVDVSDFKLMYDTHVKVPNAPTALTLTESGATVNVTFTPSTSTEVTEYEIWSSVGDTTHYKLIGILNKEDMSGSTYTFVDDIYTRKTTIYYKVYAKNGSVRSTALTGSKALANNVPDPTSLVVVANIDSFDIHYTLPQDRRLNYVEILVGKNAVSANLSEATASVVYSGLSSHYVYKIPQADYDLFHQVWVRSVTRT